MFAREMLKVTFLLSYFSVTKSTKSHLRGFSILLKIFFPRARVSRVKYAWRVRATKDKVKIGSFAALRGFSYTTRANIAHEEAEQIRARIVCTPAINAGRAWGILCADESKDFRQPSPAGSEAARGE